MPASFLPSPRPGAASSRRWRDPGGGGGVRQPIENTRGESVTRAIGYRWAGDTSRDDAGADAKTHRWNMMLAWMLEAGADATQPTRTPVARGAFTHCLRQTKCEALELLLDSLTRSENLQEALRQKDALGGFAPPRLRRVVEDLVRDAPSTAGGRRREHAGVGSGRSLHSPRACPGDERRATRARHRRCFGAVRLLREGPWRYCTKWCSRRCADAQNRTFLHFLHPHLVADTESSLPSIDVPYKDVISHAVSKHPDASQLLAESRLERERWHAPKQEPAPHTAFDALTRTATTSWPSRIVTMRYWMRSARIGRF